VQETEKRSLSGGPGRYAPEHYKPSMGGDDFSCYLDHAPGVYFRLGSANDGEATQHPLHHACFDVDESALPLGAHLLAQTAWDFLSQRR